MVEQIIGSLCWPCKHGCGITESVADLLAHFASCPARPGGCLLCTDKVAPSGMLQHYKNKHKPAFAVAKKMGHGSWAFSIKWNKDFLINQNSGYFARELEICGELIIVLFWVFEDLKHFMITAFHCVSPRSVKLTFGSGQCCRMTFEIVTEPIGKLENGLVRPDFDKGFVISAASISFCGLGMNVEISDPCISLL
jgi:hypothetical protein